MENQKHYICTGGCHGVSKVPGVCQAEDCVKHLHELTECPCTDGKHYNFSAEELEKAKKETHAGSEYKGCC